MVRYFTEVDFFYIIVTEKEVSLWDSNTDKSQSFKRNKIYVNKITPKQLNR